MLTCPAFGGPSRSPLAPNLRPHAWHPSRAGTRCLSMAGPRLILARTPSDSCNSSSSHGHASQRASPAYRKCSPFPNLASALSVRGIGARPPTWLRASFARSRGRSNPDGGVNSWWSMDWLVNLKSEHVETPHQKLECNRWR